MRGTINLDQFTATVTAVAGLVDTGFTSDVREPETIRDHPFAEGFNENHNIVPFPEFFSRQCRTEVG
jgi:hypothetical protein